MPDTPIADALSVLLDELPDFPQYKPDALAPVFEAADKAVREARDPGVCQTFGIVAWAVQPADRDTLTIGADTYEFNVGGGNVSNDSYIAVEIGADAAASLANLVDAINATRSIDRHENITLGDLETPAKANGTEAVVADVIGQELRIRSADAPGGTPAAANPSRVLANGLTDPSLAWDVGDVDANTLAGRDAGAQGGPGAALTITAAMISASRVRVSFPFPIGGAQVQIQKATGELRAAPTNDTFTFDNGDLVINLSDIDATDIDATDFVTVIPLPA